MFLRRPAITAKRLLIAGAALGFLTAAPAQAGFEIRGAGIPQAAPQTGGAYESDSTLAPIGMMPDASGQATIPVTAVPIDAPAPVDQAPMMANAMDGDVLSGFGDDLPLVIALQQVAPAGYQFAFSPGIDLGQRVSWQGGKPWRDVARDMLGAQGLVFETRNDNVLMVMREGESAPAMGMQNAAVTPPPAPAAPAQTADVRRQKPSSLIGRIRSQLSREEAPVEASTAPRSAAEEMTAEWDAAENDVASSSLNSSEQMAAAPGEDLSPIALAPAMRQPTYASGPMSSMDGGSGMWQAEAGMTLRDVMQNWASQAGVQLYWSIDYDYRLKKSFSAQGSFAQATAELFDGFTNAKPRPYAQLHQQGGRPRTLVVKAYGLGN